MIRGIGMATIASAVLCAGSGLLTWLYGTVMKEAGTLEPDIAAAVAFGTFVLMFVFMAVAVVCGVVWGVSYFRDKIKEE